MDMYIEEENIMKQTLLTTKCIFALLVVCIMLLGIWPGIMMPVFAVETTGLPTFVAPITGTVHGAGYDESAGHFGIDLYPSEGYGAPVHAIGSGTLIYSCPDHHTSTPGDKCSAKILLDEPFTYNGYNYISAYYTHMSGLVYDVYCNDRSGCIADYQVGKRQGALPSNSVRVEAGDVIGYVGKGNGATHLHLSFETGEAQEHHMMPNSEYLEVDWYGFA